MIGSKCLLVMLAPGYVGTAHKLRITSASKFIVWLGKSKEEKEVGTVVNSVQNCTEFTTTTCFSN